MSSQADELRAKAGALFNARHSGSRGQAGIEERRIGGDLPNGPATLLRATWRSYNGGPEDFSVRGWIRDPFGELVPMTGFGLTVRPSMLLGLAVLVAQALDELEVSDRGLRPRPTPPCDDGGQMPDVTARLALPSGRRGGR